MPAKLYLQNVIWPLFIIIVEDFSVEYHNFDKRTASSHLGKHEWTYYSKLLTQYYNKTLYNMSFK